MYGVCVTRRQTKNYLTKKDKKLCKSKRPPYFFCRTIIKILDRFVKKSRQGALNANTSFCELSRSYIDAVRIETEEILTNCATA